MEEALLRTHFHPLCFFLRRTNTALSSLPAWPLTRQTPGVLEVPSLNWTPIPQCKKNKNGLLYNVEIIKGELSRRPQPTVGRKQDISRNQSSLKSWGWRDASSPSSSSSSSFSPPTPSSLSPLSKCCKQQTPSQWWCRLVLYCLIHLQQMTHGDLDHLESWHVPIRYENDADFFTEATLFRFNSVSSA